MAKTLIYFRDTGDMGVYRMLAEDVVTSRTGLHFDKEDGTKVYVPYTSIAYTTTEPEQDKEA